MAVLAVALDFLGTAFFREIFTVVFLAVVFLAVVFLAVVFLAVVLLAVVFLADAAELPAILLFAMADGRFDGEGVFLPDAAAPFAVTAVPVLALSCGRPGCAASPAVAVGFGLRRRACLAGFAP